MSVKKILIVLFVLLAFASSCRGAATPQPTIDPGQIETQVAELVAAQLTEIALSQPSATPVLAIPSSTPILDQPTELPTFTVTSAPVSPTSTSEPASPTPPPPTNTVPAVTQTRMPTLTATTVPFACQLVKQRPENGKTFDLNDSFDTVWTVKNTGSVVWNTLDIDYRYKSGDEIHENEIYDLSESTKPGESIELAVDMKAPDEEGKFKTTWGLQHGNQLICTLTVEINVED